MSYLLQHWSPYWVVLNALAWLLLCFCINLLVITELRLYKQEKAEREHQELLRIEATLGGVPVCLRCGHDAVQHSSADGSCLESVDVGESQFAEYKSCDCPRFLP